jgi:steroid delta-isomerase-like uncharacterized protein
LVRRVYEAFNKQNLAVVDELYAPDFVWHDALPGFSPDLAGLNQAFTAAGTAFPDGHWTIEDQIAEGGKVTTRYTVRGTHGGEFLGVPPTGKQARWTGIEIDRIEEDKLVEMWPPRRPP